MIKDFNSFKTVNPKEIVLSIKQLENKGVVISKSSGKGFEPVKALTKIAYDPTRKPIKKFSIGDKSYELVNVQTKGKWYNSWFGVLLGVIDKSKIVELDDAKNDNQQKNKLITNDKTQIGNPEGEELPTLIPELLMRKSLKKYEKLLLIHLYERKGVDLDLERGELLIKGVEEFVTVYLNDLEIKRRKK
jgi:hypothetical protein